MKTVRFFKPVFLLFFCVFFLFNCKKEKITTYENLVIDGNTPPPYYGVTDIQIEQYVSKLYIDITGKQPTQTDIDFGRVILYNDRLSMVARDTVISRMMRKKEYYDRVYNNAKSKFIQGINDFQLNQEILTQDYVIGILYARGDTFLAQVTEVNRDKLILLRDADSLYQIGAISVNKFYSIFTDNTFYDNINMGSLNFVKACFEDYFLRSATQSETTEGVKMVDGESKIILRQNGNSKDDFIKIVTESDEFYEGLVRDNYRAYLSRDPTSNEAHKATVEFKSSNDLKEMKKSILKTDEYAGF